MKDIDISALSAGYVVRRLVPDDAALMPEQQTAEPVSDLNEIVNLAVTPVPHDGEDVFISGVGFLLGGQLRFGDT